MNQLEKEQARYEQGYAAGRQANQSNPATGLFLGVFAVAVLGIGAWLVFAQTNQQSTGDTDVINIPKPDAPQPDTNINVPKPEINLPEPGIDIPNSSNENSNSSNENPGSVDEAPESSSGS